VSTLESSLSLCVREFDAEQMALVTRTHAESESAREEVSRLQRTIELKSKEMNRVKKLAKNILDQRTDVERFLLDALQHVKGEITANRYSRSRYFFRLLIL